MLQALVLERLEPSVVILQSFLEVRVHSSQGN